MSLFNFGKKPQQRNQGVAIIPPNNGWEVICGEGYTSLDKNPEVLTACNKIADLVASMTIYLMENGEKGDKRIVNELSRKIDINPNEYMTRYTLVHNIVMSMLLYGKGNAVVYPTTNNGLLGDLIPIEPNRVTFVQKNNSYSIAIDGIEHSPSKLLHFVYKPNPNIPWMGEGIRVAAKDIVANLAQARATEKAFTANKYQPNLIIKVDALTEEFSSKDGRDKLLNDYFGSAEKGQPWLIPAEQFSIEQVRPMSLQDIALNDNVTLNKKSIAAILGIPAFVLGVGDYSAKEWDNFISSTIGSLAKSIEQELTRKLLLSSKWYFKFNVSSLYSYDLKTTADVYSDLYVKGIVDGNEVRDKLSMSPKEGLDELIILENYIPLTKVGEQLKLKQEE